MKRLLIAIGVLSVIAGVWTSLGAEPGQDRTRNCGASAIIRCGTFNQTELNNGIKNQPDAAAALKHYGVPTSLSGAKKGTLRPSGEVVVDGKVVATGAQTLGRLQRASSKSVKIGNKTYYQHSARTGFPKNTPVFVFFDKHGNFVSALAKVCGNPITATPVKKPTPPPKPTPKYTCDNLTVTKISRTSVRFSAAYTAQHATHKSTTYVVRDANGATVQNSTSATFTTTTPGTYSVEAIVSFTVDGKTVTATSTKCKKQFTVAPEPVKEIKVCELDTKKIITIDEKDFDRSKHSTNLDDCKEEPVKEEPVVTPPELPTTGLTDNILYSGFGLGSVVAATAYYAASRRNLLG